MAVKINEAIVSPRVCEFVKYVLSPFLRGAEVGWPGEAARRTLVGHLLTLASRASK
jgi:hypothetical protein